MSTPSPCSASPRALRLRRHAKRIGIALLGVSLIAAFLWFWPASDTLVGPRRAVLHSTVSGLDLGVTAIWYDVKLNPKQQQLNVEFSADGTAQLPAYVISTSIGRLWLKRLLQPRDL